MNPHVPSAWMDRSEYKGGYEIDLNRHLCHYPSPRPLEKIDAELKKAENKIVRFLREVAE